MKQPITALAAVVAPATLPGAAFSGLAFDVGAGPGDGEFPGDTTAVVSLQHIY